MWWVKLLFFYLNKYVFSKKKQCDFTDEYIDHCNNKVVIESKTCTNIYVC